MNQTSEIAIPRISVLIPVYNVAAYVEEAIASIQAQTVRDIEIIVVDDGSTDQTPQLIQTIAAQDPRVRILKMPEKGGHGSAAARNLGLTACRAPYIAIMDGDDISIPDRLEKLLSFLETHPEIALVGSAIRTMDEHGQFFGNVYEAAPNQAAILKTVHLNIPCLVWLARKDLYDQLQGYRIMPTGEDHDFLLRALSAGYRLHNLPEPLYWVRIRKGNSSERTGIKQYLLHYYLVGLYKERMKHGSDSFSPASLAQATQAGRLQTSLHSYSNRCLNRARFARTMPARCLWGALSLLISPWQGRLALHRLQYKRIYAQERDSQNTFPSKRMNKNVA
jgi:glycosyltransferase involved in cell wall biosynthesis